VLSAAAKRRRRALSRRQCLAPPKCARGWRGPCSHWVQRSLALLCPVGGPSSKPDRGLPCGRAAPQGSCARSQRSRRGRGLPPRLAGQPLDRPNWKPKSRGIPAPDFLLRAAVRPGRPDEQPPQLNARPVERALGVEGRGVAFAEATRVWELMSDAPAVLSRSCAPDRRGGPGRRLACRRAVLPAGPGAPSCLCPACRWCRIEGACSLLQAPRRGPAPGAFGPGAICSPEGRPELWWAATSVNRRPAFRRWA